MNSQQKQQQLIQQYSEKIKENDTLGAKEALNELLQIDPNSLIAHTGLGFLLTNEGSYQQALDYLVSALDLCQLNEENKNLLINILMKMAYCAANLGLIKDAISIYGQVLDVDFTNVEAIYLRSQLYLQIGELQKAMEDCKQVIYLPVEKGREFKSYAHFTLMNATTLPPLEEDIEWLIKDKALAQTEEEKCIYEFALASGYDKTKQYQKAFDCYVNANALKRKSIQYDSSDAVREFGRIKQFFGDFDETSLGNRESNNTPIFIVGLPRSGTTLIESVLANYPNAYALGEVNYLERILAKLGDGRGKTFPDSLEDFSNEMVSNIAKQYYTLAAEEHDFGNKLLLDKLPGNYQLVGVILAMNPNAKIVHCFKEPLDACFSLFKQVFKQGHKYCYSLKEIGEFYGEYKSLMEYWNNLYPGRIFDLSYEKFVDAPDFKGRELFEYCGLEWNDDYLNIDQQDRLVNTASQQQVRVGINKNSVGRWRQYDEGDNLKELKKQLADFL